MKTEDKIEDFDFGFNEINTVEDYTEDSEYLKQIRDLKFRLTLMYKSILPLLENLEKNPEKNTIHWPDRRDKIKAFKIKLKDILEGNMNE